MAEFSVLYGNSLYALAKTEDLVERIYADLGLIAAVLEKQTDFEGFYRHKRENEGRK